MNARLRLLRKSLDMTLKEFGSRLGVTDGAISRIETGKRDFTDQMILSVCREFNISEEWLRNGTGEMYNIVNDDYTRISVEIDKNDPKARQAIIDYWNLSESDKQLFWNFIEKFVKK